MRITDKTTMQINFFMKAIMIVLFIFGAFIFYVDISKAVNWKTDPTQCPTTYNGQKGNTGEVMCGLSGVTAQWYDSSALFNLKSGLPNTSVNNGGGTYGGYVVNCDAFTSPAPYCDNGGDFWCSPSSTCNNLHVVTVCQANTWASEPNASVCSTSPAYDNSKCISGWLDCDGGNDCEILNGGECTITIGGNVVTGTYSGCSGTSGNCVPNAQNFITGNLTIASTAQDVPFLYGRQYGAGDLINITRNGIATSSFVAFNSGQVAIGHNINVSTTSVAFEVSSTDRGILIPRLTTNPTNGVDGELYYDSDAKKFKYYNGDTLTWGELGGGLPSGSIGQILVNNGGENWVTSSVIYVNTTTGRVGIGNTSPSAALNIGTEDWDIAMVGNPDSSISLTVDSGNSFYETYGTDGATGLVMKSVGTNMDFAGIINDENGFSSWGDNSGLHIFSQSGDPLIFKTGSTTERMRITSGGNVGIGTTTPLAKLHINDGGFISEGSYTGTTSVFMGYLTYKTGATS
ncbi:MAG: hypothetical protein RBS77_05720, partial [Candidatus Moranbacteria bacterium]|nr:hypothetical protein [Candidatus Moranbacteria bacterium]